MLKVTIECYPYGNSRNRERIETVYIVNQGQNPFPLDEYDDLYQYEVWRGKNPNTHRRPGIPMMHMRHEGIFACVSAAMMKLFEEDKAKSLIYKKEKK